MTNEEFQALKPGDLVVVETVIAGVHSVARVAYRPRYGRCTVELRHIGRLEWSGQVRKSQSEFVGTLPAGSDPDTVGHELFRASCMYRDDRNTMQARYMARVTAIQATGSLPEEDTAA